jgi:hypothetical protein
MPLLGSASAGAIPSTVATVVQTALILATTSPPTLAHLVLPLVCAGSMAVIYGVIFMVLAQRAASELLAQFRRSLGGVRT